jgi:hypothetical protein
MRRAGEVARRGAVPVVLVADSHQEEGHGIRPARNYPVTITPTSSPRAWAAASFSPWRMRSNALPSVLLVVADRLRGRHVVAILGQSL